MKLQSRKLKTDRLSNKLLSKRGETIMETLVSLLIMGLLITSLLSIIRFSMVLTGDSLSNATASQEIFNAMTHGDGDSYATGTTELVFTLTSPLLNSDITATQGVHMSIEPEVPAAFIPNVPAGGG